MSKSIFSYILGFIGLASFSFEVSANITVSVPTTSTPTVPVTVIPSTTGPVTVQSVPAAPATPDFVPVTPISTVPSTPVNLNKYSNTVSPQTSVMPAPVPRSYVLYASPFMGATYRYNPPAGTVLDPSQPPSAVVGPLCMQGFKACIQISIVGIDDNDGSSTCKLHNPMILPNISVGTPMDGSPTFYNIWFRAYANTQNSCSNGPGISFYFVVNCVPANQVQADRSGAPMNACTP